MAKKLTEILAELAEKLGREISLDGTNSELRARITEAEEELALINSDDSDDNNKSNELDNKIIITEEDKIKFLENKNKEISELNKHDKMMHRHIRLNTTLHVFHYVKGRNRHDLDALSLVDEIVVKGREIIVNSSEAALLISDGHATAV